MVPGAESERRCPRSFINKVVLVQRPSAGTHSTSSLELDGCVPTSFILTTCTYRTEDQEDDECSQTAGGRDKDTGVKEC